MLNILQEDKFMKKGLCFFLSLLFLLCSIPSGVFALKETTNENYALGAKYAYDSDVVFLENYSDENANLLTDGVISYEEKVGETVGFAGTYKVVSFIIDLGECKDDVKSIVFRGVHVIPEGEAGNRGFSKEKTIFRFSEDGIEFNRNKDFTMTSERKDESFFYDFTFTFDAPVSASSVQITMYSPLYVLSLSEIEVYSGDASEETSEAVSEGVSEEISEEVSEGVSEETSEEISEEIIDDAFNNPTYRVNYALGADYVYEEENPYLAEYKDTSEKLLTNGKTVYTQQFGETVAYTGSGALISLTIDLNVVRDDIESVFFGGVLNTQLTAILPPNRGFSEDKTNFFFSTDGVEFVRNKSFTMVRTENDVEVDGFYDYEFVFDVPVSARYVKILMYSPVYILSLSEIEVLGTAENVVDRGEFLSDTKWRYTEKGTLVFSGKWEADEGLYLYPWKKYNDTVKRVVAENGISYIGEFSECKELEEVYMASSVQSFARFSSCEKLHTVRFSKNIKEIPNLAFERCFSLENIKFREGLVSICGDAFNQCVSIKEVILPSTLEELEFLAFFGCTSLEKIEFNSKIEKICGTAFLDTKVYNDKSNWDGDVFYLNDILMLAPWNNKDELITIKDGTRVIAADAFMDLENLKKIIIPDTVEYIGDGAFYYCTSLESVNIPDGITEISPYTFGCCFALKEISLPKSVVSIGESSFTGSGIEKMVIPDSVEYIGLEAFAYCLSLTDVAFGEKNIEISNRAFYECLALNSITVPKNVVSIGKQAFGYCYDEIQQDYVIFGTPESEAEKYAVENGIKFIDVLTLDEFYLDVDTKTLPNIKIQTTVSQIKSKLSEVEITDKNGSALLDTDLVGTGSIITMENGEKYTIIVSGDVDGDAEIDSTDYMQMKAAFLKKLSLENEFFAAADVDKDNEISSTDYLKIKSFFIAGNFTL